MTIAMCRNRMRAALVLVSCGLCGGALHDKVAPYDEKIAIEDIWLNQACDCSDNAGWPSALTWSKVPLPMSPPLIAENKTFKTMAYVMRRNSSECVVVFRGSKNTLNDIEDAYFFPVPLSDGQKGGNCSDWHTGDQCMVHSGFLGAWYSVAEQVRAHLSTLQCRTRSGTQLAITGHSLGAAMAVLAAYDLLNDNGDWKIHRVYTYGQPRVGNEAFAAAFTQQLADSGAVYYRVVDYRDAVPHVPLRNMTRPSLGEDWVHPQPEVYYNRTALGHYVICDDELDMRCSYQWSLVQTLEHTCDHCSYLGLNPCDCNVTEPHCQDPKPQ